MPEPALSFDGLGQGFTGPAGDFTVELLPPSPAMDVGPNNVVQAVNSRLAVFSKGGVALSGPTPLQAAWVSGTCMTTAVAHSPVVLHDALADRWLYAFVDQSATNLCVAVSRTPDPTGLWFGYQFTFAFTIDQPRLGLWPDAYYLTANGTVCALRRASMLAGEAATIICRSTSGHLGLTPADLDGPLTPPAGEPLPVVALHDDASLAVWKFHVDWAVPASSSLTGPTLVPVTPYARACGGVFQCIPQPGTTVLLDGLDDSVMPRLSYRRFADGRESLLSNHTIASGGRAAIRWYELRLDAGGATSVFQEGTYSPDAEHRWLASMAQDGNGNAAVGYSLSSATTRPSIRYAGRLVADPAGTLPRGEGELAAGAGSQTYTGGRWGLGAAMVVDPTDDCTFWFTSEYLPADGSFNWRTRISAFRYTACGPYDFGLGAAPSELGLPQGGTGKVEISSSVVSGWAGPVTLEAGVDPPDAGVKVSLSPTSLAAGEGATLAVDVAQTTPPGVYKIVVRGTGSGRTRFAGVTLTVTVPPDFTVAAEPSDITVEQGGSGTSVVSTALIAGTSDVVSLSTEVNPQEGGVTASLSPEVVGAGDATTLTVDAAAGAKPGKYTITVTGRGSAATHATSVAVTVPAPPPDPDFSLTAAPSTLTVARGSPATSAITTAVVSGTAPTVELSAAVSPAGAGVSGSVSPASITAGAGATLTVEASASATPGTYTVTVTGSGAAHIHVADVAVTVPATPDPSQPGAPRASGSGCQAGTGGPLSLVAVGLLLLARRRARDPDPE